MSHGRPSFLASPCRSPPRHVQSHGIAPHTTKGVWFRNMQTTRLQSYNELELMMQVGRRDRVRHIRSFDDQTVSRLAEEERRLSTRIVPHLPRMFGIVPPNAVNPSNRETPASHNRNISRRRRRNHEIGHRYDLCVHLIRGRTPHRTITARKASRQTHPFPLSPDEGVQYQNAGNRLEIVIHPGPRRRHTRRSPRALQARPGNSDAAAG